MTFTKITLSLLLMCLISACASNDVVTEYSDSEKVLDTGGDLTQQFHSVLYYPDELALDFPGYIVGVEKVPVSAISNNPKEAIKTTGVPNNDNSPADLYSSLVDQKTMLVTHIIQSGHSINCAIYSAYQSKSPENLVTCQPEQEQEYSEDLYTQSWQAMRSLRRSLEIDINNRKYNQNENDDYSHIIVLVMGWNTNQEEAIRNFNSIGANIIAASNGEINPLFVGLTWPSLWESGILDPAFKIASYPNKAFDADEVGLSWLGVLIHQTLSGLDVPNSVVIGHSFGARASSMATCVGPAISENNTMLPRSKIDLLIGLQGAYSMNRFYPDKGIETPQYQYCENANKVLLTASVHDKAMDTGRWAPFVGNETTFKSYCIDKIQSNFDCHYASESVDQSFAPTENHFIYVNADNLIRFNAYKSGGGAHSDIYRIQMGRFLWQAIQAYASGE